MPRASDTARIWQPVFPSRPIDSNVEEAFPRSVNRHRDDRRDGKKVNLPQPLGLMFNHLQCALEACPKGYDGDGYLAHRILRWKFGISYAFDVPAIDEECWPAANSRQWNVFRDPMSVAK